jgi:hypothetical protein
MTRASVHPPGGASTLVLGDSSSAGPPAPSPKPEPVAEAPAEPEPATEAHAAPAEDEIPFTSLKLQAVGAVAAAPEEPAVRAALVELLKALQTAAAAPGTQQREPHVQHAAWGHRNDCMQTLPARRTQAHPSCACSGDARRSCGSQHRRGCCRGCCWCARIRGGRQHASVPGRLQGRAQAARHARYHQHRPQVQVDGRQRRRPAELRGVQEGVAGDEAGPQRGRHDAPLPVRSRPRLLRLRLR